LLAGGARVELVGAGDRESLRAALRACDALVHLEYRRPPGQGVWERLASEWLANVVPTVQVLSAAAEAEVGQVCFASSTAVYNAEAAEASPYALAKLEQERLVRLWSRFNRRPAAILRLATVFGPGETVSRAVPNFIRAALAGSAAEVDGDGRQQFDLIYVDDVTEAFIRALLTSANGTFDIGTGFAQTPRELAQLIGTLCGAGPAVREDHSATAREAVICDVSRAASVLGFRATTPLIAGLEKEIAWFRASWRE
jgi:UDP-glucose 4-epimerase